MSHYFHAAAKCDLSTASTAPVPLFNDNRTPPSATDLSATQTQSHIVGSHTAATTLSIGFEFQHSRAALDGAVHADIRRDVKREANVLMHLANREAKMHARQAQEAELTAKLLQEHRRLRGEERMAKASSPEAEADRTAADSDDTGRIVPADSAGIVEEGPHPPDMRGESCSDAVVIPMFERIKIEEERRLRRSQLLGPHVDYGGSIVSLYNTLTFDALRQDHPDVPPTVLVDVQRDRLIPSDTSQLCAARAASAAGPYGKEKLEQVMSATTQYRERLARAHEQLRAAHDAAVASQIAGRAVRDGDSATVLRETMEQDHARREFAEASRLLKVAQFHEASLLGAFSIDASGARTDPLLPVFPDNVQEALQLAKKPRHPIDVYQAAVRARQAMLDC